ncbi:MAG: helix-turn-helix transcriptional regulator [Candidatus Hydrothermarchaeales archaeon]
MRIFKKPTTENERLFTSVLLVFIVYFGLNSVIFAAFGEDSVFVHYLMTLSFLGGMVVGILFFLWSRPRLEVATDSVIKRNIEVLKKAMGNDEKLLIDMISDSEGVTQDSIRFKTGFSKSKVSALISEMEKKDIVVREKLGRTYKIFISDWLKK